MNQYDIYLFDYLNQDKTKKIRPVLILEEGIIVPVAEITSHSSRGGKDYIIKNWKESGLLKPSVIRFEKIQIATPNSLKQKIGHLSETDIIAIKEVLK